MAFTITLVCDDVEDLFDTMVRLAGPHPERDEKLREIAEQIKEFNQNEKMNAIAAQINALNNKIDLILSTDNLPKPAKPPKANGK